MVFFNLASQKDKRQEEEYAAQNPYEPLRDSAPNVFAGTIPGVGRGVESAAGDIMNVGAQAGARVGLVDDIEPWNEAYNKLQKDLAPNPQTSGFLGDMSYQLTRMLAVAVPTVATGGAIGGAFATGGVTQQAVLTELTPEIGEKAAQDVSMIQGAAAGLGVVTPAAIPGKLATRVASGAAMNVGIGAAQRYSTAENFTSLWL